MLRVKDVDYLGDYRLALTFSNGERRRVPTVSPFAAKRWSVLILSTKGLSTKYPVFQTAGAPECMHLLFF